MYSVLQRYYNINAREIVPMTRGKSASVFKIATENNSFILKSQKDNNQVHKEFSCLDGLSKLNISPEPVYTVEKKIYFTHKDIHYILMHFFEPIENEAVNMNVLGKKIKLMHSVLNQIDMKDDEDRFDEEIHISKINDEEILKQINYFRNIYHNMSKSHDQLIHADLGNWNILIKGSSVNFIDFGEARMGHPYFDLAAVVESMRLSDLQIETLLNGYDIYNATTHKLLNIYRIQWRLRGLLVLYSSNQIDKINLLNHFDTMRELL